jgi:cystathionine gamma-synthase
MRDETRLFWLESPSNPTLAITDIAAVATIARDANAICAVDNTWATPLGQRPLELGAHVSMHATTKYLGGHSDVLGGALVFESEGELADRAKVVQDLGGAVPSPFDCWLVMRGLRTLPYRVRAQTQHAAAISAFLSARDGVEQVFWPGLRSHPGREVAERQMTMFGGMLSFIVDGGAERAMEVAGRVRIITRATSLGGPETLIEHRKSVEGPESRSPDGLLRLSVGLEHPDDIIEDLDQALS